MSYSVKRRFSANGFVISTDNEASVSGKYF